MYHDHGIHNDCTPASVRKIMSVMEDDFVLYLEVRRADVLAQSDLERQEKLKNISDHEAMYKKILEENQCVRLKDLAVNGSDLMEMGIEKGPKIGDILSKLLDAVIEDPSLNKKDILLKKAGEMK